MPELAPDHDQITDALNRILGWAEIMRSHQLARFLSYIVERTLAGNDDAIKAYSIAVDVFGRPADFDPQSDPIVRVQARRLRGLLGDYYRTAGSEDPVIISLPTGRYVPVFLFSGAAEAGSEPVEIEPAVVVAGRTGDVTLPWFALIVIALGIAALAYALSSWEPRRQGQDGLAAEVTRPSVAVVEFQNLTGDADRMPMVAGLAIELVTDLEQFEDVDIRYTGSNSELQADGVAIPEFVLTGVVRIGEGQLQYSAILTQTQSGSVVWSHAVSVDQGRADEPGLLDEISGSLSLILGSSRGPLHAAARSWLAAQPLVLAHPSLYACMMLFHGYRDSGLVADAARADSCFARLPETERQSAPALAAWGSLMAEYVGPDESSVLSWADRYSAAEANLARAVELAPVSGFVWEQQARLYELGGKIEEARAAYGSAIQLNPANADALAGFGRLLAFRGNVDEALPMAQAALEAPEPPAWYYGVPALAALRAGDFGKAIEDASRYSLADRELGPVIAVMASLGAGDSSVVNRYLPQILDVPGFRGAGILPQLRKRVGDEALLRQVRIALTNAGVPLEALTRPF